MRDRLNRKGGGIVRNNTPVLIGKFQKPQNVLLNTFDLIEFFIDLAVDTGVDSILILGDFNDNQAKRKNSRIADILVKYDMVQLMNDATHFTETSSSVID